MNSELLPQTDDVAARTARIIFLVSFVITLGLYVLPFGRTLAWPFVLISTLAHELGHGLGAILVGGRFQALLMWSDGSGVATWTALVGRFGHATIAAGGLLGPSFAAAILLMTGRRGSASKVSLVVIGCGLVVAEIFVVRTLFGFVFVALVATACLVIGIFARPWLAQAAAIFLAVQLALSVFSRGDYLFTREAITADGAMPSDVAQIANALFLPYWFWGATCGAVSVAVLAVGFAVLFREP